MQRPSNSDNSDNQSGNSLYQSSATESSATEIENKELKNEIKRLKYEKNTIKKNTINDLKLKTIVDGKTSESEMQLREKIDDLEAEIKKLKIENTHLKIENTHLIKVLESTEKLKHGLQNSVNLNTNDKIVPLGAQSINNLYDNNIKENSRLKYINALQEGTMPKSYFKTSFNNEEDKPNIIHTVPKIGNFNTKQSAIQ